jgi:ATP-dependent DNA helicase RecQ
MTIYEEIRKQAGDTGAFALLCNIAKATGFSRRLVQVVAPKLEDFGILTPHGKGFLFRRSFRNTDEVQNFLIVYDVRLANDQRRLTRMMDYGESSFCRMRLLREYFGEDPQLDCGICDNCRARTEGLWPAAAEFNAGQRVRHPRLGSGSVIRSKGKRVTLLFEQHANRRTVHAAYLRRP